MKKFHLFLACVYLTVLSTFMAGCESCDMQQKKPAQTPGPCDQLSKEEHDFAMKLGPMHRSVFCQKMDTMERQKAMEIAPHTDDGDQAVEEVLKRRAPPKTCPHDN